MKISVCVSYISALKALMAVLAIFAVKAGFGFSGNICDKNRMCFNRC